MKRLIILLLSVCLMASLSTTAFADLIFEPEDPFFEDHRKDCERIDRSYRALTEVTVYESPESADVEGTLKEGDAAWIIYSYTDSNGNQWGYCENYETDLQGWLPMAYTELIYDGISFEEEYGHLFVEETGELDMKYTGHHIYFWNYPGSETGYQISVGGSVPAYWHTYTDEEGRVWGYTGYYMGWKGYWFCLDNPTADFNTLYPEGQSQKADFAPGKPDPTFPAEEIVPQPSSESNLLRFGITAAVIACVCVTAVMLVKMKKKKN